MLIGLDSTIDEKSNEYTIVSKIIIIIITIIE